MFEMFTDRARRVVVLAQEEARMLDHNWIGTEHLLLGLLHEGDGVAATALQSMGIGLDAVRQQVEQLIGRGEHTPTGHIPFTRRAKKTMELALRESQAAGRGVIDTEDLLLGLIREGDGVATQVLIGLGADLTSVRQQVILLAPGRAGTRAIGARTRGDKRELARLIDDARARGGLVEQRLTSIERWVGMTPDLNDLDQEIAHLRREKESAIDHQDFETAATLRDKERELLDRRTSQAKEWAATAGDRLSLADELGRVTAELERLRGLLRQHGIDDTA